MTTTPSVADVLGGPATGEPGVFPDDINLAINDHVRHHLIHLPDPVVRPGGWPFAQPLRPARRRPPIATTLASLGAVARRVGRLGEGRARPAAGFVVDDDQHQRTSAARAERRQHRGAVCSDYGHRRRGRERPVRPFVIVRDHAKLSDARAGRERHVVDQGVLEHRGLRLRAPRPLPRRRGGHWSAQGVPVGVQGETDVFVDYPASDADNHAADPRCTTDVGKWVALGGEAYHLGEACRSPAGARPDNSAGGRPEGRCRRRRHRRGPARRLRRSHAGPQQGREAVPGAEHRAGARTVRAPAKPAATGRAKRAKKAAQPDRTEAVRPWPRTSTSRRRR